MEEKGDENAETEKNRQKDKFTSENIDVINRIFYQYFFGGRGENVV